MRGAWLTALKAVAIGLVALLLILMVVGRVVYRQRLPRDPSAFTETEVQPGKQRPIEGHRHLVVVFRSMGGRPLDDVRDAIRERFQPRTCLCRATRVRGSRTTSARHRPDVPQCNRPGGGRERYNRITLVGYSMGALIARKMLVCLHSGCEADYGASLRPREWKSRVDRLVLLAGMNRGWATHCEKVVSVEQAQGVGYENDCRAKRMSWSQWIQAEWGQRFGPVFGVGRMILAVQRGEPFVANLRLEWLELQRSGGLLPPVVQLLGDIDELVSRDDNLDQFVTSNYSKFAFIQLEGFTNHSNVVELTGPGGAERRTRFIEALTWPIETLRATYAQPLPSEPEPNHLVKRVVLILHGIRDDGRWAKDLGALFEQKDASSRTYSRSNGDFSALYFLLPTRMEANVRWFVDQYTELKAL